jgi:penicillin-binding protein 1B
MGRSRRKAFRFRLPVLCALTLAAGAAVLAYRAETLLSRLVLGGLGESFSTRVFAAPAAIGEGTPRDPGRLLKRLERLSYRRVREPRAPGEYSWKAPVLMVFLRGFSAPLPAQDPGLFSAAFPEGGGPAQVADASGSPVPRVWIEPELAAELSGAKKVRREPAASEDIPQALKDAVVATEDKRFFSHWGIDPRALVRSGLNDLKGGAVQGGSTITQQLAKNLFLSPRRTLRRKLVEAGFSLYLEARLSKERILALYLNEIYMGQDGPVAGAGVKAAARFYFDKDLGRLSLGECAMLAGLIRSPYRYNPRRDLQAALERRDFVLRRMREEGFITAARLRDALSEPLAVTDRPSRERRGPSYFVAEAVRQALPRYGEEALFREGLSLYTTMDPLAQAAAENAVRRGHAQAALVAIAPEDGRVLALVGGRDFSESQFNRATQARRQPGSAFKPFLYGAALEKGFTPVSLLDDRPKTYPGASGPWRPRNYDGVYLGTTTLRAALAHSLNAASLDLANQVGPAALAEFARRMGVKSSLEESLALALGTSEVSLLELTAAYAPFGNGGFRVAPRLLAAVYDAQGGVLEFDRGERESALDPARAYLLTSLLESVTKEGTAKDLPRLGFARPCAGKTGTTEDGRDAWFVGYTPQLLAGVWVGDDRNRPLKLTGAKDALPVWAAFMKAVSEGPATPFAQPQGLVTVTIDPASGLKARAGCPQRQDEVFVAGTEPTADCPLHPGGVWGWLKKWFRRP